MSADLIKRIILILILFFGLYKLWIVLVSWEWVYDQEFQWKGKKSENRLIDLYSFVILD